MWRKIDLECKQLCKKAELTINLVYKVCKAKNNLFSFMMQILPQIKNFMSFAAVGTLQCLETRLGFEDIGRNLSMKSNTPWPVKSLLRATVQAQERVRTL